MTDVRRLIPRTDALLAEPRIAAAVDAHGKALVKSAVTRAQERARQGEIGVDEVAETVLRDLPTPLRPVLNVTGVLVHTNLGRAPLSPNAIRAVTAAAGCTDVEFSLVTGQRARRGRGALEALEALVPAAAHVVNNNAAALLLCALTLAAGKEIVVSRGELVEIGDGFRIPDLLASTGARLREVGTTNRTHVRDYADAVGPDTGFVLKVHPSNFEITGFTSTPDVAELTGLGVPVVVDVGSGLLRPHPLLPAEPDVVTALDQGADLVTCSGDKLLGGPQCGLMFGSPELVTRLRRHPAARALRVDKLTLAALEATLNGPPPPVVAALQADVAEVEERARRLVGWLHGIDAVVVASTAVVGGGGAPGVELPSAAVSLPESYAEPLRANAVVGRVEHGRCLLDLRALAPEDDAALLDAVRRCTS